MSTNTIDVVPSSVYLKLIDDLFVWNMKIARPAEVKARLGLIKLLNGSLRNIDGVPGLDFRFLIFEKEFSDLTIENLPKAKKINVFPIVLLVFTGLIVAMFLTYCVIKIIECFEEKKENTLLATDV